MKWSGIVQQKAPFDALMETRKVQAFKELNFRLMQQTTV